MTLNTKNKGLVNWTTYMLVNKLFYITATVLQPLHLYHTEHLAIIVLSALCRLTFPKTHCPAYKVSIIWIKFHRKEDCCWPVHRCKLKSTTALKMSYRSQKDILLMKSSDITFRLTTMSLSGGLMPETSWSFHYWQPAPRRRLHQWLTKPENTLVHKMFLLLPTLINKLCNPKHEESDACASITKPLIMTGCSRS